MEVAMRRGSVLLLLLASSSLASADQVVLKGGRRVTGVVIETTARSVVLETGPGRVCFPASQVERIETGQSALASYRRRAAGLRPDDVAGWLDLALWARDAGLETQAQEALARALATDPENAAAHQALGHVRLGERWGSVEESYRAQGLVPFEGEWITPGEREAILRHRTDEALAERARIEADARAREAEARARAAEAEARRAELAQGSGGGGGIPYGFVLGGGCSGWNCGRPHTRLRATQPTPVPEPPPPPPLHDRGRQH
jgi:hypothetical protein